MQTTWRNKPKIINKLPDKNKVFLFIDESGEGNRTMLKKAFDAKEHKLPFIQRNDVYILNGVCISAEENIKLTNRFNKLKTTLSDDGVYNYSKYGVRPIIFHNHEMCSKEPPYTKMNDIFVEKLNKIIKQTKYTQITSGLNYYFYTNNKNYEDNKSSPLLMCLGLLMVNYAKYLQENNKKGIVIFEEETKIHDEMKLKYITKLLNKGNKTYPKEFFKNITAVYFRKKWTEEQKNVFVTTAGLELADLTLSPMRRLYHPEFLLIENKFYNHPNYINNGINFIT